MSHPKMCQTNAFAAQALTGWFQRRYDNKSENTGIATAVSRRIDLSGGCRTIQFRLEKGDILELTATEEQFNSLKEHSTGTLTWKADSLLSFTVKE